MRILIQGAGAEYIAALIAATLMVEGIESVNYSEGETVPVRGNYERVSIEVTDQELPGGASNLYQEQVKP